MWIIYALLSAFTAALTTIFGKIGVHEIDTTLATTVRSIIMAIFLISVATVTGKLNFNLSQWTNKDMIAVLLSALAGALSWLFYFVALKQAQASQVASIDRLSLVFIVILAFLFLGESLTLLKISGVILMIIGAIAITI